MDCPRCQSAQLELKDLQGIEVDKCPQCQGLWLDHHELDQLEDLVLDEDRLKGTMVYAQRGSEISCPKCSGAMSTFNYRAYDLPIDFCDEGHGFWLDAGEDKQVLELMEKRIHDMKRASSAESGWHAFLKRSKTGKTRSSKSFFGKIKGWFKG